MESLGLVAPTRFNLEGFHNDALEHIPESLWPALGPILEQIAR